MNNQLTSGTYKIVFNRPGMAPEPMGDFTVENNAVVNATGVARGMPMGPVTYATMLRITHMDNGYYEVTTPYGHHLSKSDDLLEKGAQGDWQKEGYKMSHTIERSEHPMDDPKLRVMHIRVHAPNGDLAAHIPVSFGWEPTGKLLNPDMSEVKAEHRRKGIASAAYAYAEKTIGGKMMPGYDQSHDAHALWRQPNKPFGKSAGADAESKQILENKKKPEAQKRHKFRAAKWTHPNGHPRCLLCGDEERTGGVCEGALLSKSTIPAKKEIASVAVIDGNRILMGKRNDNQRWTLPGGGLNPGEDPKVGAFRELKEEAGIAPNNMQHLATAEVTTYTGKQMVIHSYVVFGYYGTDSEQDPDQEVQTWKWIDITRGLPQDIKDNLHSPKNATLAALGLIDEDL